MSRVDDARSWLTESLPALLEKHDVPGAAVGVLVDGEVADHAAGVLSKATGVEATADSVFQIGSITKLWTSTLTMQLVEEGLVELDASVRTYLPEFRVADEEATEQVTVRQLLTHTSGFEGDIFVDTGTGDDAVEKFLRDVLPGVPQVCAPGEMWSYNNAGFVVLGRLLEVLRDKPYDAILRERLIEPLGLEHAAPTAYDAILHRAAVGHVEKKPGSGYEPAPVWALTRSNAPAGSMLAMSPRDLLAFARMHLSGGSAGDGTPVLSAETTALMHSPQASLPALGRYADSWGLGFERFTVPEGLVIGHDGGTIGQSAFLRMVPDAGVAVTLLTNGGSTLGLYQDVVGHLVGELTDTRVPEFPVPPEKPERVDASRYVGTYSCRELDLVVAQDDDGTITATAKPKGLGEELGEPESTDEFVANGPDQLIQLRADRGSHPVMVFLGDDGDGRALYAHYGRAIRRAGS